MNEELYINGIKVELPLRSVSRTLQINDIGEVKDRQSNFSNSIKIAMTPNNVIAFDTIGLTGSTSKLPYQNVVVKYVLDGIELVPEGKGVLKSTTTGYNLIIYDGNISMSGLLGDSAISDLDWSLYNHILNTSTWEDSLSNTSGYIYSLGKFYNNSSTELIDLDLQSPSFYVHTLFSMIFSQNGWTISGDFLLDANYTNRVISNSLGYDRIIQEEESVLDFERDNTLDPTRSDFFGSTVTTKEYLIDSIVLSVSDSHRLNLIGDIDIRNGINEKIKVYLNGVNILEFNNVDSYFNESVSFTGDILDVVSVYVEITSQEDSGVQKIIFDTDYTTKLYIESRGVYIDFSEVIGNTKQIDFVKDIMQRYGLSFKTDVLNKNFEFKQWKVLLEDYDGANEWSDKYSSFVSESYTPNYAQRNYLKYKYTNDEDSFADGVIAVDNENLSISKDLFTSVFKASSLSENPLFYNIELWKDANSGIEPNNDGIRIFKITKIEDSINYRLTSDVVNSLQYNGITPYLDFNTIDYNSEINYSYAQLKSLLNTYKYYTVYMNLSVIDIYSVDFFKLVYLKQFGSYFYINKISNYKPSKRTKVELVKVGSRVVDKLSLEGSSTSVSSVNGVLSILDKNQLQGESIGYSHTEGLLSIDTILYSLDTNDVGGSSGSACSQSLNVIRYHDGAGVEPFIDDYIYIDSEGLNYFNGSDKWFKLNLLNKIQISSLGRVIDKQTC